MTVWRIPTDLRAEAHSTSAAGENSIDLAAGWVTTPYLKAGDVVSSDRTSCLPKVVNYSLSSPRWPTRCTQAADTTLTEVTAAFQAAARTYRCSQRWTEPDPDREPKYRTDDSTAAGARSIPWHPGGCLWPAHNDVRGPGTVHRCGPSADGSLLTCSDTPAGGRCRDRISRRHRQTSRSCSAI